MKFSQLTLLLSLFGMSIQAMDYKLVGPEDVKYLTQEALAALIKVQKPDWVMPSDDEFKAIHKEIRKKAYADATTPVRIDQRMKEALFDAFQDNDSEIVIAILEEAKKTKANLSGHNFEGDDLVIEALKDEKYKCARALIELGPNPLYDFKPAAYYYKVIGHKTMPDYLKNEFVDLIKSKNIPQ